MACNSCAKPFSLFRQEKGCPSCGFSYCSKCLNIKIFVSKLNAEAKVCSKCKNSDNIESKNVVKPPDAYYRRIGVMNDKQSISKTSENDPNKEDQHILERLKKLKEDRYAHSSTTDDCIKNRLNNIKDAMPSTSDSEIQARLDKLRGVPSESITGRPALQPPDTRTEQDQVDDLLKQYLEQTAIDTKYNTELDDLITDLESRVQKLKGTSNPTHLKEKGPEQEDSENEEEIVKKIVEKVKAEASLEEDNNISPSRNDELPFCEICNEDAMMRCLGCRYLFCKQCFIDHKDDDDGCNRYEPYEAPKTTS